MLRELFLGAVVFVGAGIGGVMRYALNRFVPLLFNINFPLATFIVNISGCTAMGLVAGWFTFRGEDSGQTLRLFLTTGILGGYTTFSAFSLDAALLWERGAVGQAAFYVGGSVAISLFGLFIGMAIMRAVLT